MLIFVAVLALIFWSSPVLAPLRVLVVVAHECGHALAALLTGGQVEGIQVGANEGGLTFTRGGWQFLILNGGYLGSLLFGVLLLLITRKPGSGRPVMGALGLALVGIALIWFRPILAFGFFYTLLAGVGITVMASWAPPIVSDLLARFLGVFSVLYAMLDIRDDVFRMGILSGPWYGGSSYTTDAHMLADATGVPAPIWGVGWMLAGLAVLFALRKRL